MGTVFGFVASDVTSKLKILQEFRNGEQSTQFETVEQMILFEKKENLLSAPKYVSGCRTLLRLHRALSKYRNFFNLLFFFYITDDYYLHIVFIALFLEEVGILQMEDNLASGCQKAYSSTLALYHPWIIRKPAILAMYVRCLE